MSLRGIVLATAAATVARGDCPKGCPQKCPAPEEFQSDLVKSSFDINKFWGTYYELAMHDSTQPCYSILGIQTCEYCTRSVKTINSDGKTYKDLFSFKVAGADAICDLEFNITDQPGQFLGHWHSSSPFNPGLEDIVNTVVDVGANSEGQYDWTLEFQCRDDDNGINFAAVNFYHKNPIVDKSVTDEMADRLRASGLGWIMDIGSFFFIDHKPCAEGSEAYPANDADPAMCGQKALAKNLLSRMKDMTV
jgi:hypothetical protein